MPAFSNKYCPGLAQIKRISRIITKKRSKFLQILLSESAQIRPIRRYPLIFTSKIRAYPRNLRTSAFYPVLFVYFLSI